MRRLFYLSGTVCFLLVSALVLTTLSPQVGESSVVDSFSGTGIAAISRTHFGTVIFLTTSGEVWRFEDTSTPQFTRLAGLDPPMPVSSIVWWDWTIVVADNGDIWQNYGESWTNLGPLNGPVTTESTTWGAIKTRFAPDPADEP